MRVQEEEHTQDRGSLQPTPIPQTPDGSRGTTPDGSRGTQEAVENQLEAETRSPVPPAASESLEEVLRRDHDDNVERARQALEAVYLPEQVSYMLKRIEEMDKNSSSCFRSPDPAITKALGSGNCRVEFPSSPTKRRRSTAAVPNKKPASFSVVINRSNSNSCGSGSYELNHETDSGVDPDSDVEVTEVVQTDFERLKDGQCLLLKQFDEAFFLLICCFAPYMPPEDDQKYFQGPWTTFCVEKRKPECAKWTHYLAKKVG